MKKTKVSDGKTTDQRCNQFYIWTNSQQRSFIEVKFYSVRRRGKSFYPFNDMKNVYHKIYLKIFVFTKKKKYSFSAVFSFINMQLFFFFLLILYSINDKLFSFCNTVQKGMHIENFQKKSIHISSFFFILSLFFFITVKI